MVRMGILLALLLAVMAGFLLQPLDAVLDAEATLTDGADRYASEIRRLPDASYLVAVRTPMPDVKAHMVRWWFADFLATTEHYGWWHPEAHVWMAWENKQPGKIVGASHLVHEYIGADLAKLRIQFVPSAEFFGYDANDDNTFALCARVGLLDAPINVTKMCHIVRNTEQGAEMRSRFWLGHVAKRAGNETVPSLLGRVGNSYAARWLLLRESLARALHRHATEEMAYLAALLPNLYASENARDAPANALAPALRNSAVRDAMR